MRQGYGGYYITTCTEEGLEFYTVKDYFEKYLKGRGIVSEVKALAEEEAKYSKIMKILKGEYGKPKYVHIVTHGKPGPALEVRNDKNWWEWWKSDWKDLTPKDIKKNLREKGMSGCKLVFLSACYSLQNYKDENSFGYVFVVWCGVENVIGSKGVINSYAMAMFAIAFYERYLAKSESFAQAYADALSSTKEFFARLVEFGMQITLTIFSSICQKCIALQLLIIAVEVAFDLYVAKHIANRIWHLDNIITVDEDTYSSSGSGGSTPGPGGGGGFGPHPVIM